MTNPLTQCTSNQVDLQRQRNADKHEHARDNQLGAQTAHTVYCEETAMIIEVTKFKLKAGHLVTHMCHRKSKTKAKTITPRPGGWRRSTRHRCPHSRSLQRSAHRAAAWQWQLLQMSGNIAKTHHTSSHKSNADSSSQKGVDSNVGKKSPHAEGSNCFEESQRERAAKSEGKGRDATSGLRPPF